MRGIDSIDRQLIAALSRNARTSHADLATHVNLSRNAVRQRVERLERDGIIRGYTILRGSHEARPVTAVIFIDRHDRMRGGDVLRALLDIPEVIEADIMTGDFDLLVRVEAASNDRVQEIWQQLAALPGVANTVTSVSLSPVVRRSIM
ncbi:Lrp/AsnC family transcriptional regulator [Microbacterium sp. NPDC077644]|uniref:Lrp/AsnC family transcriptional regulator n=1 Tax=Microbacterium sp. NPDC077644 TaxID=3155055 RepID=UPI00344EBAD1